MVGEDQQCELEIREQGDLEDTLKGSNTIPDSCQKDCTGQQLGGTGMCCIETVVISDEACIL
jgi:hypothetical protein